MDPATLNLNVNVNSMSQQRPANDARDLDAQLQLAAEGISTWAEPFSNLDLSVYTLITQPVLYNRSTCDDFVGKTNVWYGVASQMK